MYVFMHTFPLGFIDQKFRKNLSFGVSLANLFAQRCFSHWIKFILII